MKKLTFLSLFILCVSSIYGVENKVDIDSVICRSNSEYSYSVYQPKGTKNRNLPVVFFFDPGARSWLPLTKYHSLAEQYQVLFVCPHNSRNGPYNVNKQIADALVSDVFERYAVDTSKVLFSGFSGGSRFSYQYASLNPVVKGVIACGAGLPNSQKFMASSFFLYSVVIGSRDSNIREFFSLKDQFIEIGNPIQFITFDSGHVWPPTTCYERALLRMLLEFKSPDRNLNASDLYKLENKAYLNELKEEHLISASWPLENMINLLVLKEYSDTARINLANLYEAKDFKKQQKDYRKSLTLEDSIQQKIISGLYGIEQTIYLIEDNHKPLSWWNMQIKYLKRLSNNKNKYTALVGERSLTLIQMQFYEYHIDFMAEKAFKQALELSKILLFVDESNMYYYIMQAQAYAALGKTPKAEKAMEKAEENGFDNYSWAKDDPYLKVLFVNR